MERYSFFDAQQTNSGYDRTYSSADLAAYFASFVGNGVYANPARSLMIQANKGLTVKVLDGKAWINGYFYELSEENKTLTVNRGDNTNPRIDAVVLSLNHSARLIEVKVVQGSASTNPTVPALVRNDTKYELLLATISVPAGTTEITNGMIKDMRFDDSVCGIVSGVIEQIDTTQLFNQYDSQFDTWFKTIKGTLSGDVAGNLGNQISTLKTDFENHKKEATAAHTKIDSTISTLTGYVTNNQQTIASQATSIAALQDRITLGTDAAPSTGKPNTIYVQML